MSIEEQITAALDSRAVQRPFVDDLTSNWDALANSFETLTSAAEDLAPNTGPSSAKRTVSLIAGLTGRTAPRSFLTGLRNVPAECACSRRGSLGKR